MKKTELRVAIRKIVREEVAMAIQGVITELKKPTTIAGKKRENKPVKNNKHYTKNSVLNEVMNEVANANEWKTMGDKTHTSEDMTDILAKSYGGMMNGTDNALAAGMGVDPNNAPDFLTKDYRAVMKKINEK